MSPAHPGPSDSFPEPEGYVSDANPVPGQYPGPNQFQGPSPFQGPGNLAGPQPRPNPGFWSDIDRTLHAVPPGGAPAGPITGIRLHCQGTVRYNTAHAPTIRINGHQVIPALPLGSVIVPLPPGAHRVEVMCRAQRPYGHAEMDVSVGAQHLRDVYYAAPGMVFMRGAMGLMPQKRRGGIGMILLFSTLAAILIVGVVLFAAFAIFGLL